MYEPPLGSLTTAISFVTERTVALTSLGMIEASIPVFNPASSILLSRLPWPWPVSISPTLVMTLALPPTVDPIT